MRLLLSWLKEYVNLKLSPEKLRERLILSGTNFESIEKIGNDIIFNLEITPNRPDCLSIVGLAREVSALTNQKLKLPEIKKPTKEGLKHPIKIKVEDKKLCPRYTAAVISGLKVSPSPKWLKQKLIASGIRPINNIVDATNYTMLELGQPIHAFDYEKLQRTKDKEQKTKEIIVRRAKEGEKIKTLDGVERRLNRDILVIADSKKAIGIAGVMGGETTEVGKTTKTIVLESATFSGPNINETGRVLGLRTEALDRFEKGLDINNSIAGLYRCIELILEICGGRLEEVFDLQNEFSHLTKIRFDWDIAEKLLGVKIPQKEMVKILTSLGFLVKDSIITVPSWRGDIAIPEDLVEEIGRIYGYEKIKSTLPVEEFPPPKVSKSLTVENLARQILKGAGCFEVYNYSFISKDDINRVGIDEKKALKLINPLAPEFEFMRPSLIPSILLSIKNNLRNFQEFKIFELSKIYWPTGKNQLPKEPLRLTAALVLDNPFCEAKGIIELLFEELDIKNVDFKAVKKDIYYPGIGAQIVAGGKEVGMVGEVRPDILANFSINKRVALFDLDFEKIVGMTNLVKKYKPIPKYPAVKMDLAFVVPEKVLYKDILETMKKAGGNLVSNIELFDIYKGKQIGEGKKSLAFSITYGANRTLSQEEAKKVQEKIIKALKDKFGAAIRS